MKIKLDKYLKSKREQLDVEEPDEILLWEGIRKGLPEEKKGGFNIWKVAAIVLAFITFSYILYNESSQDQKFTLSQISKSLGEREKEYRQVIKLKMQSAHIDDLSIYSEDDILPVLFSELDELDTIYLEAMQDLERHGYLEPIVDIIFDTYEKRIRLLEQIMMESQKLKIYEKDEKQIIL
jgi:hypothetical protein